MDFFKRLFGGPPSRDKFAQEVLKTFADMGVPERFKYVKDDFSLVSASGEVFNLHNFYDEYCRMNRDQQQAALRRWAMVQFETINGVSDDVEEALLNLRPKLWMKWSLEHLRFQSLLKGTEWKGSPVLSVGTHLCIALVYDLPHAMSSIHPEQLHTWGLSFHQALDAAKNNLEASTLAMAKMGDGLYSFISGDNYDASRLVLLDRLQQLEIQGEMIAATPNRDTLLITGSEDVIGLEIMFDLIKNAMKEPRPMSPIPMRLVGDQWFDWQIPPSCSQYLPWREMQMEFLGAIYNEQQQYLDALHQKTGTDVFVASYTGLKKKTGETLSYSVWTEGIPTLLPRTDVVYIGRQNLKGIMVHWDQMEAVVGDLVEPTDNYPPRYAVNSFPTPEQMGRLESVAFDP